MPQLLSNQCRHITKKQHRLIYCNSSCVNICVTRDETTATQNTLGYFRIYQVVNKTGRYDFYPLTCQRLHSWIYIRIADMLSIRLKRYGPHHFIKVLVADILPSTGARMQERTHATQRTRHPSRASRNPFYHWNRQDSSQDQPFRPPRPTSSPVDSLQDQGIKHVLELCPWLERLVTRSQ